MGRRITADLGAVAKGGYSSEAVLDSVTLAVVMVTATQADDIKFTVQASPSDLDATADWYDVYHSNVNNNSQAGGTTSIQEASTTNSTADATFVYELPLSEHGVPTYNSSEQNTFNAMIPRRLRIVNTGGASEADFSAVRIEGKQRRA